MRNVHDREFMQTLESKRTFFAFIFLTSMLLLVATSVKAEQDTNTVRVDPT